MKQRIFTLVLVLLSLGSFAQENGYSIVGTVTGVNDGDTIYLANYFGKKLYYADTAYSVGNTFEFKGDSLRGGKYAVVLPGVKFFEIIVAEDKVVFETEGDDFIANMKVKESQENQVFYHYVQYLQKQREAVKPIEDSLKAGASSEAKKQELIKELKEVNSLVEAKQIEVTTKYKDLLVGKFIYMSMPIQVPDPEEGMEKEAAQKFQRAYYVNHFFDHFDFSDDRIVRDGIFENKVDEFFKKVVYPQPDSINFYLDRLISQSVDGGEVFKFLVHYGAAMYEREKVMGMDAVFVHMVEKYYMPGMAYWADSAVTADMTERAMKLKPTLIGQKAPYLNLFDTTETNLVSLYDVKAKYTILYFWDSGCGHCKKVTPVLKETYHKLKEQNVKVYAVGTELENDKWKEYIIENELDFINVSDKPDAPGYFRTVYDIFSTPRVFVLDENKTIIAKQLSVEQLEEFILNQIERESTTVQ